MLIESKQSIVNYLFITYRFTLSDGVEQVSSILQEGYFKKLVTFKNINFEIGTNP